MTLHDRLAGQKTASHASRHRPSRPPPLHLDRAAYPEPVCSKHWRAPAAQRLVQTVCPHASMSKGPREWTDPRQIHSEWATPSAFDGSIWRPCHRLPGWDPGAMMGEGLKQISTTQARVSFILRSNKHGHDNLATWRSEPLARNLCAPSIGVHMLPSGWSTL